MRRMVWLIRHEFTEQAGFLFALLAVMAVLQTVLFGMMMASVMPPEPARFERLVDGSGIAIVFTVTFICIVGLGILQFLRSFMYTKSIYTSLTLPFSRRLIYMTKLLAVFGDIVCLLSVQMLLLLVFHRVFAEKFADTLAPGSLYLSFFRSRFLKTIFPPEPISAATMLLLLLSVGAYALSIAVCIKAKDYRMLIVIGFPVGVQCIYGMFHPFSLMTHGANVGLVLLLLSLALLFVGMMMGAEPFEKGEVST